MEYSHWLSLLLSLQPFSILGVIRCMHLCHQDIFVNRRSLGAQQGLAQISVEEAVSREDIHVAFICTENVSHEDSTR